jgi:hypothetical protein
MPTFREMACALFGAIRLAMMESSGLDFFDRSTAAAIRSFAAALVVLPAYVALLEPPKETATSSWLTFFVVEAIAYVCSWTAYALVMDELSRLLDRSARYPVFLSVYNWSSVVQMMIYLPAFVLSESGWLSPDVAKTVMFAATLAVLIYQWFLTRVALDVPGFTAAGLVLIDFLLSVLISSSADGML